MSLPSGSFPTVDPPSPAAVSQARSNPPAEMVDRLSSLPRELILMVFEHLRSNKTTRQSNAITSLAPLSRSLRYFQRTNLYFQVRIWSCAQLVKFHRSCEDHGVGHLVHHLHFKIKGSEWKAARNDERRDVVANALAGTQDLSQLRSLQCRSHYEMGDILLKNIDETTRLIKLKLLFSKGPRNNITRCEELEDVSLRKLKMANSVDELMDQPQMIRKSPLKKLQILGHISPQIIRFIEWSSAFAFDLHVLDGSLFPAIRALNSITCSRLSLCRLDDGTSTPRPLTIQLDRLNHLQHLTLIGRNMKVDPKFFTSFLKSSPIITLTLCSGFDLNARDLTRALLPNSATQLKLIRLDHIDFDDDGYSSTSDFDVFNIEARLDQLSAAFTAQCTVSDMTVLHQASRSRGITLVGTAMGAYWYLDELLEQLVVGEEADFEESFDSYMEEWSERRDGGES